MAKIHTHYDNLKVSRMAPQEVIRAAYKALSQKYHPDKNPGDEKAARIMAILNSAYGTLADPQRRREHDEWIASEEWEIEWLESTHNDDQRDKREAPPESWKPEPIELPRPYRVTRDPRWWLSLGISLGLGCVAGVLMADQPKVVLPAAIASAMAPRDEARAQPSAAVELARERATEAAIDSWAVGKAYMPDQEDAQPDIKTLAVTELVVPPRAPQCGAELHALVSPNGDAWPAQSGYVEGYPVGNKGGDMEFTVDNSANPSAVFVKIYDLERRSNVRHTFILAHDTLTIAQLAAGRYEVRYQNIDVGAACANRRKLAGSAAPAQ